ncbi:DNA gyrase/topoisomerase IV subunit B [Aneurinibacillus terranovensis]|uniref:DNA gyrase/topoisomerase IV subunit B n=1 Tax=Aneurinibacillus terranovensis TaxID=278991 RepID=UPI0003F5275E|nr:DNA gyrase subunit B [Aneurinibacillus terranovensis]
MARQNTVPAYNDDDIRVLKGLTAVRVRPGMYIGSTGSRGLHHLIWEIIDNCKDEVLAGYCDTIKVSLFQNGSISVEDNGRGIPTGINKDEGIPTPTVVFTVLHAGGKFGGGEGYKKSGGLHGVGASVVNALSEWLEVEIYRDGNIYRQRFEYIDSLDGDASQAKVGHPVTDLEIVGTTHKTGTKVTFQPDPRVFNDTTVQYDILRDRLRDNAFLLKGVTIQLNDMRPGAPEKEAFHFEEGIKAFIEYLNDGKNTLHDVVYFEGEKDGVDIELAFQYNDNTSENLLSYVNTIPTIDEGTHVSGFRNAMTKVLNDYARRNSLLKKNDKNLTGNDYREGLMAVLSIRMDDPQFESQTKDKLGSEEARSAVEGFVSDKMNFFLEENPDFARLLIERAIESRRIKEEIKKAAEALRNPGKKGKKKGKRSISDKYTPPSKKDPSTNELFIVEGDSAGGSAINGRNRNFQAVLSLRGKPINVEKKKIYEIIGPNGNEEINTIVEVIGTGIGDDFNANDCMFDKIIIMTDADYDGAHIQILLLTLFYRYFPELIKRGKVYIAQPPLYKVYKQGKKGQDIIYAWTEEEKDEAQKKFGKQSEIQRYKGLGEMNAEQLWDTTMNPETRKLIRVDFEEAAEAERIVTILMGDKVPPRRDWIESNVKFVMEEE